MFCCRQNYMKQLLKYLSLVFLLTGQVIIATAQGEYLKIQHYRVYLGIADDQQQDWIILRKFDNADKTYLLLVNPQTLETKTDEANLYHVKPVTMAEIRLFFKNTPYVKALKQAEKQSGALQNAGIKSGSLKETGITLTADLCPSHKPLDRRIFTAIDSEFKNVKHPAQIALSVSGVWMQKHNEDLAWLKQLQRDSEINIIWINHSFNHHVSPTAPLNKNFLLEPGTNINYEVLETEKLMLKNGLLPSVFFRFPGLVSSKKLVYRITGFGLVSIGTDAWLAKGQQPQAGSIVLIHANGNESVGVKDFLKLLESKSGDIANKQWSLYDLRQSLSEEFGDSN